MVNMIEENKKAFSSLSKQIRETYPIIECKRYFKTNENEKKWLQKGQAVGECTIFGNAKASLFKYEENTIFILIGLNANTDKIDNNVLLNEGVNSGIATRLIADGVLNFSENISASKLYDNVLYETEESYSGHDLNEIIEYFNPITFLTIPKNSILENKEIHQVLCYVLANTKAAISLNFEDRILKCIEELSLEGAEELSFSIFVTFY